VISATNCQSGGEDRCYREKFRIFFSLGGARSKTAFFRVSLRLSCAQPTGNSFTPSRWYWWKAETLKVCLLLMWTVCDQAFGRYRTLKGVEKWARGHDENWKFAYSTRRKIHWFQKCYSFRSTTKNNEVIAEKPFQNSGITGACERLAVLNCSSSSIHYYGRTLSDRPCYILPMFFYIFLWPP